MIKFRRTWALQIGRPGAPGVAFEGDIDLQCRTSRGARGTSPTADLTIRNPDRAVLDALAASGAIVRVLAGYVDGGPVELIAGSVVRGSIVDETARPDRQVRVKVAAGAAQLAGVATRSYGPGVAASTVIRGIARDLGIPVDVLEVGRDLTYPGGYVVEGPPLRHLRTLAEDADAELADADGRIRVWPRGRAARVRSVQLDAASGLIECSAPSDERSVNARVLLEPSLLPGDAADVAAPAYTGRVTVIEVAHEIDTAGDQWHTQIVARIA